MDIIKNRLNHFGEVLADSDMIEESQVVIVPDVSPDALQIIGCSGSVYLQEKSCFQGVLKASGSVNCTVVYISTEGHEPYTVNASVPLSFSKEIAGMGKDDKMVFSVRLLNTWAVMVNPRKLSLRVQLQVFQRLYRREAVEYVENMVSGSDEGVNCLCVSEPFTAIVDIAEKRLVLNDEIRLSGERLDGSCILLKNDAAWVSEDVKVLANKIMVRGRVETAVSAMDESGAYIGKSRYSVPFSQIIECDGVLPDDMVEVSYSPAREDIEVYTSADGVTTMTFAFAAMTECVVKREVTLMTVRDAFSTKWEIKGTRVSVSSAVSDHVRLSRTVTETVSMDMRPEKITDVSVIGENSVIKRGDGAVSGNFYISLVCQMADGTAVVCGKRVYADMTSEKPFARDGFCEAVASEPSCEINGDGEADVTFTAQFICHEGSREPVELISDASIDKTCAKEIRQRASLTVRAVSKNESVWDIAKRYNISPDLILSANRLETDEPLIPGRLILIPNRDR